MKLIIDIPEEMIQALKYESYGNMEYTLHDVSKAIRNGTSLPKGHGRLIDADVLCDYFWDNRSKLYTHKDLQIVVDNALTIIEADKESEG